MSEATDTRTIHQRMVAIIDELPAIGKTQRNTQQNFNFRGHDDVLNALTPLLAEEGVVIVPDVLERVTAQRTTSKGSVMFEVNLHIRYTFYGAAGDSIAGSAWGEGTDMGDKATMKAGTMAFKAMLNQAFAINTEEGAAHDTDKGTVEETVASPRQRTPAGVGDPSGIAPEDMTVHFGKNAGSRLGDLTERSLAWYADEWGNGDSEQDIALKRAAILLKHGEVIPDSEVDPSIPF